MDITVLPVDKVHAGKNPRSFFDDERTAELAESIKADGVLEPIRVVQNQDGYRIESGERRFRAAQLAGLSHVPAIIVMPSTTLDEYVRAIVTNVQREDMNLVDEARAYRTLVDKHGLTVTGVAERLGVAQGRVTQRLELLDLPASVVQAYYDGKLRLDCRKVFRDIKAVDDALCEDVCKIVAGKDEFGAVLAKEPMRVVAYAAEEAKPGRYFVIPGRVDRKLLKLKKEQEERAAKLDLDYSAYTPIYENEDLVQASNTGVAYTAKDAKVGVVVDRQWMREHFDVVIARREKEIQKRAEEEAKWKARGKASSMPTGDKPQTPEEEEAAKEWRAAERQAVSEGRVAARAANLELGRKLMDAIFTVDVGKLTLDQAKVLCHAAVGARAGELFLAGLRYCLPEFQEEVKVGKDGKRTKIVYKQGRGDAQAYAVTWLSRADRPGELVGRTFVLILCAWYADQGVVAISDRVTRPHRQFDPGSHDEKTKPMGLIKAIEAFGRDLVPAELRGRTQPSEKPLAALRRKAQAARERADSVRPDAEKR
jgi:ParB/RepB/Spo0J family partition protein